MAQSIPNVEVVTLDIPALREAHPKKVDGRDNPFEPCHVVRRMGAIWYVRKVPNRPRPEIAKERWSAVRDGDLVRIPLVPYLVKSARTQDALAFAMHVTASMVSELSSTISNIVLVCGDVEEEYVDENLTGRRIWLGFAAKVRR